MPTQQRTRYDSRNRVYFLGRPPKLNEAYKIAEDLYSTFKKAMEDGRKNVHEAIASVLDDGQGTRYYGYGDEDGAPISLMFRLSDERSTIRIMAEAIKPKWLGTLSELEVYENKATVAEIKPTRRGLMLKLNAYADIGINPEYIVKFAEKYRELARRTVSK